jgi:hypothetical protein
MGNLPQSKRRGTRAALLRAQSATVTGLSRAGYSNRTIGVRTGFSISKIRQILAAKTSSLYARR